MHVVFKIPLFVLSLLILAFALWIAQEEADIETAVGEWAAEDKDIDIPDDIQYVSQSVSQSVMMSDTRHCVCVCVGNDDECVNESIATIIIVIITVIYIIMNLHHYKHDIQLFFI